MIVTQGVNMIYFMLNVLVFITVKLDVNFLICCRLLLVENKSVTMHAMPL
jgi:hypothetical protein